MYLIPGSGEKGQEGAHIRPTMGTWDQIKTWNSLEIRQDFLPAVLLFAEDSAPQLHFVPDVVEAHGGAERSAAAVRHRCDP